MTEFRIEIPNLAERIAQLNGHLQGVARAADLGIARGAEIVLGQAILNVSGRILNVRTGTLRRRMQRIHEKGSLFARVGTSVKYARIHEYGGRTAPHIIRALHKKSLAFSRTASGRSLLTRTKRGTIRKSAYNRGLMVFVRSVKHPGSVIPARPFMRPALEESAPRVKETFTSLVAAALEKAGV